MASKLALGAMMSSDAGAFDTRADANMARLIRARRILARYNATGPDETVLRRQVLEDLLDDVGEGVWIEPPFFCDYGDNIRLGAGVFINLNCVILDGAKVEIGAGTLLGPGVQIYATSHPLDPDARIYDKGGVPAYRTVAAPVTIGEKVWIGGGVLILPGVEIGQGTTVGAGSVVTESLPERVFAAGNPARILRQL
ncbi:MAG: sugar O-acetyltransferase [Pseudomonadota bacterium]